MASAPGVRRALEPVPGARRRRALSRMMEALSTLAALIAVGVLAVVVVSVIIEAAPAISLNLLIHEPRSNAFGINEGGFANAIVGSVILIAIASAIAIPIAILVAIFTTEFAGPRLSAAVRFALDILSGVPTIVTGLFVFGVLVVGSGQSAWAGSIALAIVELPIVARAAQEVLELVPASLREAGLALGLKRWRIVLGIVLPTCKGGLVTGAVLGVARVAGETAPLLLTSSIFANSLVVNPSQPMPNIPMTIFELSENAQPQDHAQAWAAALVLILFVLLLSITARALQERSRARLAG
jgi:phosphate transport system permease protein